MVSKLTPMKRTEKLGQKNLLSKKKVAGPGMESLQGQFLVAMPMMADKRFKESVLYVVEHNADGAMAIAVHQTLPDINFGDVLSDIELSATASESDRKIEVSEQMANQPVLRGGPVQTGQGFVLHSSDEQLASEAFKINSEISLSANLDILKTMALEGRPEKSLFALGYCGWSPGQLEGELAQNSWLTAPHNSDLLFETAFADRYDKALDLIGVSRANLSAFSGRA